MSDVSCEMDDTGATKLKEKQNKSSQSQLTEQFLSKLVFPAIDLLYLFARPHYIFSFHFLFLVCCIFCFPSA